LDFFLMMRYRLLSAAVLVPVVLIAVYLGGWYFWGLVLLVLTLSGREYALLLKRQASGPSAAFVLALVWVFVLAARFPAWRLREWGLSACVLGSLAWAVVRYERGLAGAVTDWALTVTGGLYLGWAGAHFSLLRDLNALPSSNLFAPAHGDGLAWAVLALGIAWLADSGAYLVGRRWGKHKLSPRVSPFKTWEGYWGGVALATAGGALIPILMSTLAPLLGETSAVTVWDGLALGALISILSPLGDLGESMLKRHAGAKDSSNLIPGHGGMFDRIDSLLWAAVIAFYYASWAAR
jgi:phosphatidate cytidylyltransferase